MTALTDPTLGEFRSSVSGNDEEIDLARAALAVARMEYPYLEIEPVLESLNALAARVVRRAGPDRPIPEQVEALTQVVVRELGLRGADENYYDPRNSFINEVLERKTGIPISLSIIYMSVGHRAGVPLAGTAMPMHFLVRVLGVQPPLLVDCYNQGKLMTEDDCREAFRGMSGDRVPFDPQMTAIVSNGAVVTRLLTNLKVLYLNRLQYAKALPALDRLLVLNPSHHALLRERGIVHYRLQRNDLARQDLEHYLASEANPPDAREIRNLIRRLA